MIQFGKICIFGKEEIINRFSSRRYRADKDFAFRVLLPGVGPDTVRPTIESLFETRVRQFSLVFRESNPVGMRVIEHARLSERDYVLTLDDLILLRMTL